VPSVNATPGSPGSCSGPGKRPFRAALNKIV